MESKHKKIEIEIPSDIEPLFEKAKLIYHDCSQNEILYKLIVAGLESLEDKEYSQK